MYVLVIPKIMSQYALNFTFSAWILIHLFIIFKDFEIFPILRHTHFQKTLFKTLNTLNTKKANSKTVTDYVINHNSKSVIFNITTLEMTSYKILFQNQSTYSAQALLF